MKSDIDVVIIGLNAADTLSDCINSVKQARYHHGEIRIYYVDSGSSDNSMELAATYPGIEVLALKTEHPTPGAARNTGWKAGNAPLVQFLDSDTEVDPDWFELALPCFSDSQTGAVRGVRREKHPEASVYNWIADQEWNAQPGACEDFGGDVLIRREALERTGGYDDELVGGEDPELSRRVKAQCWNIQALKTSMTTHDLGMKTVAQYLKRSFRTGYGYAAVVDRIGVHLEGFWTKELLRIVLRGGFGPMLVVTGLLAGWLASSLFFILTLAGLSLLLYPRLFRVSAFQQRMQFDRRDARKYAWHCALVVVPEAGGVFRYWLGQLTGSPLRNHRPAPTSLTPVILGAALAMSMGMTACKTGDFKPGMHDLSQMKPASIKQEDFNIGGTFKPQSEKVANTMATEAELEVYSNSAPNDYYVGPGDILEVQVRERPDISVRQTTVSPDGKISVPQVGIIDVRGKTIDNLTTTITDKLEVLYEDPEVTLHIHDYNNNKVYVLGRIANPGLVEFGGTGTLLEAIALSGGLPTVANEAFLSRAMIFRGKEEVIWVDLKELLRNGNVAMNPRLRNNDIVFIPESDDELVYVMGEVKGPGAVRLKSELTVLDAIMECGGPTKDARSSHTYLVRQENGRGIVQPIDIDQFVHRGDLRQDYLLEDGDIIFVSKRPLADVNYIISSLSPSVSYLNLAAVAAGGL